MVFVWSPSCRETLEAIDEGPWNGHEGPTNPTRRGLVRGTFATPSPAFWATLGHVTVSPSLFFLGIFKPRRRMGRKRLVGRGKSACVIALARLAPPPSPPRPRWLSWRGKRSFAIGKGKGPSVIWTMVTFQEGILCVGGFIMHVGCEEKVVVSGGAMNTQNGIRHRAGKKDTSCQPGRGPIVPTGRNRGPDLCFPRD